MSREIVESRTVYYDSEVESDVPFVEYIGPFSDFRINVGLSFDKLDESNDDGCYNLVLKVDYGDEGNSEERFEKMVQFRRKVAEIESVEDAVAFRREYLVHADHEVLKLIIQAEKTVAKRQITSQEVE